MADISPAKDIWSQAFNRATAYYNGTGQSITGITTRDHDPEVPWRARVICFNFVNGALEAIALSDVGTGAYEIPDMPRGRYCLMQLGEGVYKSEVIGPVEIT